MRRRLNLERLSDQILLLLHEKFFDDSIVYTPFATIREALKAQPANAIRLELDNLINTHEIDQKTEERTRPNLLAALGQNQTTYSVRMDGFRITKRGILTVEGYKDEHYTALKADLTISTTASTAETPKWEPIPLDREDTLQKQATAALDRVMEELRKDNGYGVSYPEEKAFIQDKLSTLAQRLKNSSQISWMYLSEFAIKPLGMLITRFGKASIGIAASAAKEAISSWLKSKGIHFLDDVFG